MVETKRTELALELNFSILVMHNTITICEVWKEILMLVTVESVLIPLWNPSVKTAV